MRAHPNWRPGWDAIKDTFDPVYGSAARRFLPAARVVKTPTPLCGFAVYATEADCVHIVTCGLSQIEPARDAFAAARSGLGFELTACCASRAECADVLRLLNRIALYAEARKCSYHRYACFPMPERAPSPGAAAGTLTAVTFIPDRAVPFIESVHGRVDFLQVIDLTDAEWQEIRRHPGLVRQVVFSMHQTDPLLQLHVARTGNYLSV